MVFHLRMSDSKSPQVSMTLSILADLKNSGFWMFTSHSLISKSSSPKIKPEVTAPSVPITIGIYVTFLFHSFFNSLKRFRRCPRGLLVKVLYCGIVIRKFELLSHYYVSFRTNTLGESINPFILLFMS